MNRCIVLQFCIKEFCQFSSWFEELGSWKFAGMFVWMCTLRKSTWIRRSFPISKSHISTHSNILRRQTHRTKTHRTNHFYFFVGLCYHIIKVITLNKIEFFNKLKLHKMIENCITEGNQPLIYGYYNFIICYKRNSYFFVCYIVAQNLNVYLFIY